MRTEQESPHWRDGVPRVSVVLAAYNAASTIVDTVNSILSQTFPDFELIIVDDGSVDETARVLELLTDPRIVLLHSVSNQGVSKARNRAGAVARGEYIAVHDADDLSAPDRLARQVSFLDSHPEIGLVGTQGMLLGDGQSVPMTAPLENDDIQWLLLGENCLFHSSLMIRGSILKMLGGYNEGYPAALDYDLVLRIAEQAKVANLPDVLYFKKPMRGSITYSARGLLQKRCVVQAIDESVERRRSAGMAAVVHPKYAVACLKAACAEAAFGQADRTAAYLRKALETDPQVPQSTHYAEQVANLAVDYAIQSDAASGDALAILDRLLIQWPADHYSGAWARHARAYAAANLAFTYYRRGNWHDALRWTARSLSIAPARAGNRGLVSVGVRSFFHAIGLGQQAPQHS